MAASTPGRSSKKRNKVNRQRCGKLASANDVANFKREYNSIVQETPLIAYPGVSDRALKFRKSTVDIIEGEWVPLPKEKYTAALIMAILHGLIGSLLYGYNIGNLNTVAVTIRNVCCGHVLNDTNWQLLMTIFLVGGVVGSMLGGRLPDKFGRKWFILGINLITAVGGVMFWLVDMTNSYGLFLAARFILGVGGGGSAAAIPAYLGEISPTSLRGAIGTLFQLVITIGIFIGSCLSVALEHNWRYIGAGNTVLPVLQVFFLCTFVESPAWLYARSQDEEAARILSKLRGTEDIDFELQTYTRRNKRPSTNSKLERLLGSGNQSENKKSLCGTRGLRMALIISIVVNALQQFSGINAVMFYSGDIFSKAGFKSKSTANIITMLCNVLGVVLAIPLVDRVGRRALLLLSTAILLITCVLISWTFSKAQDESPGPWGLLTVILVVLYVIGFELGMGPIPFVICSELCPLSHRDQILGIAAGVNMGASIIVSSCFLTVTKVIHNAVWFIFAGILLVGGIFVALQVPEPKGKRPDEMQAILQGSNIPSLSRDQASIQEAKSGTTSRLQSPTKI